MTTINLDLDFWKRKVLLDALNDHNRTWIDMIRDCEEGRRPNMSLEGARMIQDDLLNLIAQVGGQSVD
jgi:hypothetical protein